MQIVRTIVWIVVTAIIVGFVVLNWGDAQQVKIWPGSGGDAILFEWPVGLIALIFFLLGFFPMWLVHRAKVFYLNRRISSLETAARRVALTPAAPPADPAADPVVAPEYPAENPGPLKSE